MSVRSDVQLFYGVHDSLAFRIFSEADPSAYADITGENVKFRTTTELGAEVAVKTGSVSGTAPGPMDAVFAFAAADFGDGAALLAVGQYLYAVTIEAGGDEPEVVAHGYLTVVRAAGFPPA